MEWRKIAGWPHEASRCGQIRSMTSGKILARRMCRNGYPAVSLWQGGSEKRIRVHRLVAQAWINPIPVGLVVNHIDGDKMNNDASNLEIVSVSENNAHARRTGLNTSTPPMGARKGIDFSDVYRRFDAGVSQAQIARDLGVTGPAISYIMKKRNGAGASNTARRL